MTDTPNNDGYHALVTRMRAIAIVISNMNAARTLPDRRYRDAMHLQCDYSVRGPQMEAFNLLRTRHADEERQQGVIARDRELKRLAVELERLRSDLPSLAEEARFSLLDLVREARCA